MGITGAEIIYGIKKASTWGTAVQAAAGDGFLGLPAKWDPSNTLLVDDSLGSYFANDAAPGQTSITPEVSGYLRYNDTKVLGMIAALMGTAAAPATHTGGTLSKDHVLTLANNVDGIFYTLVAKLGTGFVEEIPAWKIAKLVLTLETGKPVQFAISGPGIDLVADSSVNTLVTTASVTTLEKTGRAYMGQAVLRMNDQSGSALASGDKVGASRIVLTLERKLTGVYGTYNDAGAGRDLIDEPTNDGQFTGTLSVTIPRLADNSGRLKLKGNTSRKCDLTITSKDYIEGSIPYSILIQLPHLKPRVSQNSHQQGIISNSLEFDILGATAAPTGMTGITDPVKMTLVNKITTNLITGA